VYLAATGRTLLDAELAAGDRDQKAERKKQMR
jgi:ABC-2 type transport system ATP-binding protein